MVPSPSTRTRLLTRPISEQPHRTRSRQHNSISSCSGARSGRRRWGRWLSVLIVALTLSPLGFAAPPDGKGNGGGGGGNEPPSLPFEVRYRLHWLDVPAGFPAASIAVRDMNNEGFVVGFAWDEYDHRRAFCYDYEASVFMDVNDMSQTWIDLDSGTGSSDWIAISAYGTNESFEIVGEAQNSDHESRVYVLHYTNGSPEFALLPKEGDRGIGYSINDLGVVVAKTYEGENSMVTVYTPPYLTPATFNETRVPVSVNNLGEVVLFGPGGYGTVEGSFTTDENKRFWQINNWGQIAGLRIGSGKGKNKVSEGAIRINADGSEQLLLEGTTYFGSGINDDGDVVIAGAGALWMEEYGALRLTDLLVNPDSDALLLDPWRITNRNSTGFGIISGRDRSRGFILVPENPQN